jgi:DNA polymerase-3 subunit delta'
MIYPWQQSQWQQVNQLVSSQRLPHALFLQGNQGLGKAGFAVSLASALLCKQPAADHQACGMCQACQLLAAATHPDLYYLRPTAKENSKSKKPALSIRIEDIRALCEKLNQTSQYGGYRIAILDQADQLTLSAANSLLKTLEEPGNNVLIILISARAQRLPVTIRSRCQALRFTVPEENQSLLWLKQNIPAQEQQAGSQRDSSQRASSKRASSQRSSSQRTSSKQGSPQATGSAQSGPPDEKQLKEALKHAFGSPLAALDRLQDAEHQQLIAEAMTAAISGKNSLDYSAKLAQSAKFQTLEAMLSWASDLSKLVSCGPEVEIINDQYRDKLQALANKVNQQRLFRFYDQLNFNILHASIAVNEQLLWENLLLSWDNL